MIGEEAGGDGGFLRGGVALEGELPCGADGGWGVFEVGGEACGEVGGGGGGEIAVEESEGLGGGGGVLTAFAGGEVVRLVEGFHDRETDRALLDEVDAADVLEVGRGRVPAFSFFGIVVEEGGVGLEDIVGERGPDGRAAVGRFERAADGEEGIAEHFGGEPLGGKAPEETVGSVAGGGDFGVRRIGGGLLPC